MLLKDYALKDIYLGKAGALFTGVPGTNDPIPAPAVYEKELSEIRDLCMNAFNKDSKDEFSIRHAEIAYRVALLQSLEDTVFVLRRMPNVALNLSQIDIHPNYIELLMTKGLTGLIIVAGAYGQGKTTTASAIIKSRLNEQGGVAITIEDPPEMPLEGPHGEGFCYQTWVDQGGFANACRKAARWAPSIIFLGEVRDQETALEALKASINGRLVICTTHADSVSTAIERIYSLASGSNSGSEDYSSLLANGLTCVIHQELIGEPKAPKLNFLWISSESEDSGIRNNIRLRKWEQIENQVIFQKNKMFFNPGKAN